MPWRNAAALLQRQAGDRERFPVFYRQCFPGHRHWGRGPPTLCVDEARRNAALGHCCETPHGSSSISPGRETSRPHARPPWTPGFHTLADGAAGEGRP